MALMVSVNVEIGATSSRILDEVIGLAIGFVVRVEFNGLLDRLACGIPSVSLAVEHCQIAPMVAVVRLNAAKLLAHQRGFIGSLIQVVELEQLSSAFGGFRIEDCGPLPHLFRFLRSVCSA